MRLARITYEGAIHHAMNRGHNGLPLFINDQDKERLLELLEINSIKCKVSILVYCIMDNHYHLIIQNNSGRMSQFFRRVNSEYAYYYRKKNGGKGYVFQDRYKSILIQDDAYLLIAMAYVLNNPVRAKLTNDFLEYKWSSGTTYFKNRKNKFVDSLFLENLFTDSNEFNEFINGTDIKELPTVKTAMGRVIGGEEFFIKSLKKFNRRKGRGNFTGLRVGDRHFEPIEKIYYEFEKKYGVDPDKLNTDTFEGKRLRAKFLVNLKEQGGLTYREIKKLEIFGDVKFHSLGAMYRNAVRSNKLK